MHHKDFHIGLTFACGRGRWRCTDIGTRTIVAIRIDQVSVATLRSQRSAPDGATTAQAPSWYSLKQAEAEADGWLSGPPYAVTEVVFDENDIAGCEAVMAGNSA